MSETFLDGRVQARQPETGFRSGTDAVLLAAAVPAQARQAALELGSGTGVAARLFARVATAQSNGSAAAAVRRVQRPAGHRIAARCAAARCAARLLTPIDVGVQHTQDVLEPLVTDQRHAGGTA